MPIKIQGPARGEIPHNGWWFTSFRFPLDLAKRIDSLATFHDESRSNIVISLLNAAVEEAEQDVQEEGGRLPVSTLEASKHAKPPPKEKGDKPEKTKTPKVKAEKPAKVVKPVPVEEEEEIPVPKAKKGGFKVAIKHGGRR